MFDMNQYLYVNAESALKQGYNKETEDSRQRKKKKKKNKVTKV